MSLDSKSAERLRAFMERLERLAIERKENGDSQKVVFAEVKEAGFKTKPLRDLIKRRMKDPHALAEEETIFDAYLAAVGMIPEMPLHEAVRAMSADALTRDGLIAVFQQLVPINGEIIAKLGGKAVRIWRDEAGNPWVAEYVEPKPETAEKVGHGRRRSATVLELVPKDPIKAAADRAEARSKGEPPDPPVPTDGEDDEEPVE